MRQKKVLKICHFGPVMDRTDRMILTILQEDATVPVAEIGRRVGLSTTPCWRRIQKLEEQGVMMPVLENKSKYIAPARYDEVLRIVTTLKEKPGVRIAFHYDFYNEENKLIHQGETMLVFVDKNSGRPRRPPKEMEDVLAPFFS